MLDIPKIAYFKSKNTWCASKGEKRCRIAPCEELEVYLWPEPWCFDKTPAEQITVKKFEFNDNGLKQIAEYLKENM